MKLTNDTIHFGVVAVEEADSADVGAVLDDARQRGADDAARVHLKVAYPERSRPSVLQHLLKVDA